MENVPGPKYRKLHLVTRTNLCKQFVFLVAKPGLLVRVQVPRELVWKFDVYTRHPRLSKWEQKPTAGNPVTTSYIARISLKLVFFFSGHAYQNRILRPRGPSKQVGDVFKCQGWYLPLEVPPPSLWDLRAAGFYCSLSTGITSNTNKPPSSSWVPWPPSSWPASKDLESLNYLCSGPLFTAGPFPHVVFYMGVNETTIYLGYSFFLLGGLLIKRWAHVIWFRIWFDDCMWFRCMISPSAIEGRLDLGLEIWVCSAWRWGTHFAGGPCTMRERPKS